MEGAALHEDVHHLLKCVLNEHKDKADRPDICATRDGFSTHPHCKADSQSSGRLPPAAIPGPLPPAE